MANQKHLKILNQGTEVWNRWRKENPSCRPDLSYTDLNNLICFWPHAGGYNLSKANLSHTGLMTTNFIGADLRHADLTSANLISANLAKANLTGAKLSCYGESKESVSKRSGPTSVYSCSL